MNRFLLSRKAAFVLSLILFRGLVVTAQNDSASEFKVKALPLPGAHGLVMLDYIAYDNVSHRLWVPAGNTAALTSSMPLRTRSSRSKDSPLLRWNCEEKPD